MRTYLTLIGCALRSRLMGAPYKMNLNLTWRCNSRCVHCSIWQVKEFDGELAVDEYRKMFQSLKHNLAIVSFSGGQPTLKRNLGQILLSAVELLPKLCLVSLNTNALTPHADIKVLDSVLSQNARLRFDLLISLDGLKSVHDALRGVNGNFAKVEEVFHEARVLKERYSGLRIGFSTTISKSNLDDLERLVAVFPEKDFHTFDFYHVSESYFGNSPSDGILLDERDLERAKSVLRARRIKGIEDLLNRSFLALAGNPRRQPACTAGRSSISVFPDGKVKRCYFLHETVGDLRDAQYDVLTVTKERKKVLAKECRKCWNTCQAYTTLIDNPLAFIRSWFR